MSIKGFSVGGVVQRYDYTALDNLPQGQGVSDDLKAALLQLARKVAYIDDQGQTYYDDLYDALYPEKTLLSIAANFQQGQAVVYNTDSLDTLKQYLTVTAVYDDASTETVPSSAYTLSGTLTAGTSVITVTYEGKTDAFNVTVTAAPMSFAVTNNLTGCTTSNSATSVLENTSYTAVITASSGYTLVGATVSITMGGNDITTSAYSGGIITINSVTGALVISVAAVAVVLSSISAVYTQSGTVYTDDTLDSLKADLVVTAHYSDSSTATVAAADYTLSGTLTEGTSTITVSYGGKTTTFNVTVVVNGWLYHFNQSLLSSGSEDFGFTGVQEYTTGVHGDDYAYWHNVPDGNASNDPLGIKATGLSKVPDFSGDFTVAFWYKATTALRGHPFSALKLTNASGNGNNLPNPTIVKQGWSLDNLTAQGKAVTAFRIAFVSQMLNFRLISADGQYASNYRFALPTTIDTTQWHHYALTRKGGTIRFFFDGELIFTIATNVSLAFPDQVAIGNDFNVSTVGSTDLVTTAYGDIVDDLYIAEFCKWDSEFDPQAISY